MATGVELATAWVRLVPTVGGISGAISKAVGGSDAKGALNRGGRTMGAVLTGAIGGAVAMATSKAISMVTGSIDSAIKRVDTMRNFPRMMENMGYSAGDAEKSIKKMSDQLKGLPTSLDSMTGMVTQLEPLTGGLDEATDLSLALNNALLAGGKSTDLQANAMEQYTQMLAIGKVDMQGWRSMVSAMPGQMDQLSESLLGAGNKSMDLYEALKDGTVTFDDFNSAVLRLNSDGVGAFASFEQQARASTHGIATSQANLQTGITRGLADLIDRFQPQIVGFLGGLTTAAGVAFGVVGDTLDWIISNQASLAPVAVTVGGLVAAFLAFRGVIAVINGVRAAMAVWRAVQLGWNAATYGGVAASYASTTAAKVGLVAHKAWNVVIGAGRILWGLMNGSLIKAAALWVANTAKLVAHKVAVIANNAGVSLWIKLAGMQIAAGWRSVAMWAKNTAALIAHRTAVAAGAVAAKAAAAAQWLFNAAMNANPIMLIVTAVAALVAGLVYFFTQTELGQEIWASFTQFLTEAWTNIVYFGKSVWGGLSQFFSDLWANITSWFQSAVDFVVDLFMNWTVYGLIIKNWDAIVAFFINTWNNITGFIDTAITFVATVIQFGLAVIRQTWTNIWNGIKSFFTGIWDWLVMSIRTRIDYFKLIFRAGVMVLRTTWENIWNAIRTTFSNVWGRIKSIFTTMIDYVRTKPVEAFRAARDAIGNAWKGIQNLAKAPVRFVVETVINKGLIGTINKFLPKKWKLSTLKLPKGFATGGWTGPGAKFDPAGIVHADEFVVNKSARRRFESQHPGALDHINKTGTLPGFAKGGLVHPLPSGRLTAGWLGYPGHRALDFAAAAGTPVRAAGAGLVRMAGWNSQGLGNNVDIGHANGLITRYSHMLAPLLVRAGQMVKQGQRIGLVGSTGNSTGPHLHYEVHKGYQNRVNPTPYLGGGGSIGDGAMNAANGLMDWVTSKLSQAGDGVWGQVGKGIAMGVADNVIGFIKEKVPMWAGGPTLYDNGGLLPPGVSLVQNKTRRPEPILTGAQWDAVIGGRGGDIHVTIEAAPGMDEEQLANRVIRKLEGLL